MLGPLRACALRNLRIAASLYILLIIVGTHWPKLDLGMGMPPADKLMHFLGFGLAVIAFWLACWFTRLWSLFVAGVLFVALDEISQSLFSYGRTFSLADVVAGLLGVVVAVTFVYALGPVGGPLARLGRERWIDTVAALLSRRSPWMILLTAGAFGVLVGGMGLVLIDSLYRLPNPMRAFQLGGFLGASALVLWCLEMGLRHETTRIQSQHRCRSCGWEPAEAEQKTPPRRCQKCDREFSSGEWLPAPLYARDAVIHALFIPVIRMMVILLPIYLALALLFAVEWPGIFSFSAGWRALGFESQGLVDLTILGVLLAWTVRSIRKRVAARVDKQWESCTSCGQDLTGVSHQSGVGQCPECGGFFLRTETDVSSA